MEEKEEWLPVKGYEGLYEVSDMGRVRSLNYRQTGKTHILKPQINRYGYLFVSLYKDKKIKLKTIHRIVAEAFIKNPNPDEYKQVNHKSECKMLNFACVLEFCDAKYNSNYGTRNQRMGNSQSIPVDQFDKDGNFIHHWNSAYEAERHTGIQSSHIAKCAKGRRCYNTAGGYKWRYAS